jgi:hypothetical protein
MQLGVQHEICAEYVGVWKEYGERFQTKMWEYGEYMGIYYMWPTFEMMIETQKTR